jgi:hypothetical protein
MTKAKEGKEENTERGRKVKRTSQRFCVLIRLLRFSGLRHKYARTHAHCHWQFGKETADFAAAAAVAVVFFF